MSRSSYSHWLGSFWVPLLFSVLFLCADFCLGGIRRSSDSSQAWCDVCGQQLMGRWNGRYNEWQPCPKCSGGSSLGSYSPPAVDYEAIRRRQEEARRAAEEAERRRQELLQKAAEEARMNWELQDAANMAAFGEILSSKKKTGGGLSPLLMKQAEQSSGVWNDPDVVDLRDADTLTPKLLGDDRDKVQGTPLQKSGLHPLAGLSDEQLAKKKAALDKSITDIKKLMEQNVREYEEIATGAEEGLDAAKQALMDSGTTFIFGGAQGLVDKKIIHAERSVKAVKDGAGGLDAIGLALAVTNGTGDKLATAATVTGGMIVQTPLGAVPGAVKTGLDTAWVWSDYLMLKQQYDRREKLGKQYEDALIHLSSEQAAVVAEQNRRKAAPAVKQ